MSQVFSSRFPPKNRTTNALGPIQLQIDYQGGRLELDPNSAIIAVLEGTLAVGAPLAGTVSVISGEPAYLYRTDEIELALTKEELTRLLKRDLKPVEFFVLALTYGVFYELHDDFYEEESGIALQPAGADLLPEVSIAVSTLGDWVRVEAEGQVLLDDHRVSPRELANVLEALGHSVILEERDPEDF